MSDKTIEKKYPKSKSGHRCLTPCYEPDTWVIHPQSLDYISHGKSPFCPISITDKGDFMDECYVPTNTEDFSRADIEMNILVPKIDFNCNHFLKMYYNIESAGNAIDWITMHKEESIYTKLRIMECTLKEHGKNIEIMNVDLINFYIDVIKKIWMFNLFPKIEKYIVIENNKIYFGNKHNHEKNDKHNYDNLRMTKINFIIDKFVNKNMVYKFLEHYFSKHLDHWNDINFHTDKMQQEYIEYVLEKINATINHDI